MIAAVHKRSCCSAQGGRGPDRFARRSALVLAAALLVGGPGCKRSPTTPLAPPPPQKPGPAGAALGSSHGEPLAALSWYQGRWLSACGGRQRDGAPASPTGAASPAARPGARAGDRPADSACTTRGVPGAGDALPEPRGARVDGPGAPPAPCRLRYDDVSGDPGAPAARATLVGPDGAEQLLDAWKPPPEVDGDYFAVEIGFSPDGKWMGVVHTSIGVGDGERLVRVESVEIRPAPACR